MITLSEIEIYIIYSIEDWSKIHLWTSLILWRRIYMHYLSPTFFVPKRPKQWGANHHKNHSPLTQLPFRKGFSFLLEVCQCFCVMFCKMHMICVIVFSMILQEVEKDRVTSCWVTRIITCLVLSGNFLYTQSFCCWSGGSVFTLKCFSLAFFRWIWDFKKKRTIQTTCFFRRYPSHVLNPRSSRALVIVWNSWKVARSGRKERKMGLTTGGLMRSREVERKVFRVWPESHLGSYP